MKFYSSIENAVKILHYKHNADAIQQISFVDNGNFIVFCNNSVHKGKLVNGKTIKLHGKQMTVCIVGEVDH